MAKCEMCGVEVTEQELQEVKGKKVCADCAYSMSESEGEDTDDFDDDDEEE